MGVKGCGLRPFETTQPVLCCAAPEVLKGSQGISSDGGHGGIAIGPAADSALIAAELCAVCLLHYNGCCEQMNTCSSSLYACLCSSLFSYMLRVQSVAYAMHHGRVMHLRQKIFCVHAIHD